MPNDNYNTFHWCSVYKWIAHQTEPFTTNSLENRLAEQADTNFKTFI